VLDSKGVCSTFDARLDQVDCISSFLAFLLTAFLIHLCTPTTNPNARSAEQKKGKVEVKFVEWRDSLHAFGTEGHFIFPSIHMYTFDISDSLISK
jgi:hypothetical protein